MTLAKVFSSFFVDSIDVGVCFRYSSCGITKERAMPVWPARAVRPIRCWRRISTRTKTRSAICKTYLIRLGGQWEIKVENTGDTLEGDASGHSIIALLGNLPPFPRLPLL